MTDTETRLAALENEIKWMKAHPTCVSRVFKMQADHFGVSHDIVAIGFENRPDVVSHARDDAESDLIWKIYPRQGRVSILIDIPTLLDHFQKNYTNWFKYLEGANVPIDLLRHADTDADRDVLFENVAKYIETAPNHLTPQSLRAYPLLYVLHFTMCTVHRDMQLLSDTQCVVTNSISIVKSVRVFMKAIEVVTGSAILVTDDSPVLVFHLGDWFDGTCVMKRILDENYSCPERTNNEMHAINNLKVVYRDRLFRSKSKPKQMNVSSTSKNSVRWCNVM